MREPVLGDFENGLDNLAYKDIDVMGDDWETVDNTIVATEWFVELCYAGFWRVNPDWLAAQASPEPEPGGEPPAEEASPAEPQAPAETA